MCRRCPSFPTACPSSIGIGRRSAGRSVPTQQTRGLAAYGKLPAARDFLWLDVERGAGRRLRELMDGGAPALRGDVAAAGVRSYYRSPEGWTVATIWESSDAGGLRTFPFGLACTLECQGGHGVLARARPVHERQRALFEAAQRFDSAGSFEERIQGMWERPHVDRERVRAQTSSDDWSERLRAAFEGDQERLAMALWRLRLLIEAGGHDLGTLVPTRQGVVAPLLEEPRDGLADLRWDALRESLPRCEGRPEAILSGGRAACAAFLFRPLLPEDLHLLTRGAPPGFVDLRSAARPADLHGYAEFRDRLDNVLRNRAPDEWLLLLRAGATDRSRKG